MKGEDHYECVAGRNVATSGERKIIYDRIMLEEIFTDPISQNWIKDPVLLGNNIYDKETIQKWLRTSDINPLTGEKLEGDVELIPCGIIKYVLYCLEDTGDDIIFHAHKNDIAFAHYIGAQLPFRLESADPTGLQQLSVLDLACERLKYWETDEVVNRSIQCVDFSATTVRVIKNCKLYNCSGLGRLQMIGKCKVANNIDEFALEEYLFTDVKSGGRLDPSVAVLTKSGNVINQRDSGGKGKTYPFGIVMKSFSKLLNGFKKSYIPIGATYRLDLVTLGSPMSATIEVRSRDKASFQRLEVMREAVAVDKTLQTAINDLNKLITPATIKKQYDHHDESNVITKYREKYGIPSMANLNDNIYGYDLSLLTFRIVVAGVNFKDFLFTGANMKGSRFIRCKFMECCFAGADLSDVIFHECYFAYTRPFYKTITNGTKFINTERGFEFVEDHFAGVEIH